MAYSVYLIFAKKKVHRIACNALYCIVLHLDKQVLGILFLHPKIKYLWKGHLSVCYSTFAEQNLINSAKRPFLCALQLTGIVRMLQSSVSSHHVCGIQVRVKLRKKVEVVGI